MAECRAFWSYVHADDKAEGGRISRLAKDLVEQYEMFSEDKINLFLDRDDIEWGQNWRERVDDTLASVVFFIAVITPRYFRSPECRHELQFFARRAAELGVKNLVLPLLYLDVPALHDDTATDDLITLVRTFQWEDWQQLRFTDAMSEPYRRAVADLARRLVDANRNAVQAIPQPTVSIIKGAPAVVGEDPPGFLDRLETAEAAFPRWHETALAVRREVEEIGRLAQDATSDIRRGTAQGAGFAGRVIVARRFSRQLAEPVERIWSLGNEFASQVHAVDEGFRVLIDRVAEEVRENLSSKEAVCRFFEQVRGLSASSHQALDALQRMADGTESLEALSRDLRPPLRRLRQGLTIMSEVRKVTDDWIHLTEATGIACGDAGVIVPGDTPRIAQTALLSEQALADWNRPEEDAAWSHLQSPE